MESKDTFKNKLWKPATSSSSLVVTIPIWFRILHDLKEGDEISLKKNIFKKEKIKDEMEVKQDGIGISKLF